MVSEVTIPKNSKQTLLLVEKVTVQKLIIDSYFYSLKLVSTIVGRGFLTPLFYGDPVPPKLYPVTTCYVLTAAIFITLNE